MRSLTEPMMALNTGMGRLLGTVAGSCPAENWVQWALFARWKRRMSRDLWRSLALLLCLLRVIVLELSGGVGLGG